MKGIIFDFNGTLYWDSKLHYDAWRDFSKILRGSAFTDEEMRENMFDIQMKILLSMLSAKNRLPKW